MVLRTGYFVQAGCNVERSACPHTLVDISRALFRALSSTEPAPCARSFLQPAMKLLLSTEPSGRGANDGILMKRLRECRMVLKKYCS